MCACAEVLFIVHKVIQKLHCGMAQGESETSLRCIISDLQLMHADIHKLYNYVLCCDIKALKNKLRWKIYCTTKNGKQSF